MALFKRTDPDTKAREKAAKRGVSTDGAAYVAHDLQPDDQFATLLVLADRVEVHRHGKVATLGRSGSGVTVLPRENVSSVSTTKTGLFAEVTISGRGADSIKYRTAPQVADAIRESLS